MLMEGIKEKPKCRVELHVHLDGALRLETAWDLLRRKQLPLPGDGSLAALRDAVTVKEGTDLAAFLRPLLLVIPAIQGDLLAIERISREFVEDRSRDHVAYCEARFSPHLLLPSTGGLEDTPLQWDASSSSSSSCSASPRLNSTDTNVANGVTENQGNVEETKCNSERPVTVDDVMEAVLRGLAEGEKTCPGTKVRLLLCCIRNLPQWSWDVLRLCEEYKDRGVVGIDIAGCHTDNAEGSTYSEGAEVFQAAAAKGIHRTVHAGEEDPPDSVLAAMDDLKAERIGHGYRVVEDEAAYGRCKDANLHFEVCPHSSYQTGAMKDLALPSKRHPVIRFAEDGVSFSINTDDPFLTGTTLSDEYGLLRSWGFTEAHLVRANFNAALHSFLPPLEKQALVQQLKDAYGIVDYTVPTPVVEKPVKTTPNRPTISVSTWENRS